MISTSLRFFASLFQFLFHDAAGSRCFDNILALWATFLIKFYVMKS